jgi:HK97 family phage major capsid protein
MPPEPSAVAIAGWIARGQALSRKTNRAAALEFLDRHNAPIQAKAAIGAITTGGNNLGFSLAISAWVDALRTKSVFYRLMSDNAFLRVPTRTRVALISSTATGGLVPEGHAVGVSKVVLDSMILAPFKAGAQIVTTSELLNEVSAAGQACLNREISACVSEAVDSAFLDLLIDTGTTSTASAGTTAVNAKHDLRTALLAVNNIGTANLYWVCSPDVAKKASTLADTAGLDAFPAMSATGGELANLPAVVSSGVPAQTLYLIDASQIAADAGPVEIDASYEADVQMSDAPTMTSSTPTAATQVSMFQTNSAAIRATAWFGCVKLRESAVSVITGINWT